MASLLALLGAGVYGAISGCTEPSTPPADLKPDAALPPQTDANLDARFEAEAAEEPTPPRPAFVPEGWNLWTDFRKAAQIYLPTSKAVLPPPAKWEPCRADFYPPTDSGPPPCEEWAVVEPGQTNVGTNASLRGATAHDLDKLVVPQSRTFGGYYTLLAVKVATGEVLNGLLYASPDWFVYPSAPSETATIYRVKEAHPGPIPPVGYLIAPHDLTAKSYGGRTATVSVPIIGETVAMSVGNGYLSEGPFSAFERTVTFREKEGLEPIPSFYRKDTAYISSAVSYRWVWRVLRPGGAVDTWFDNLPDLSSVVLGVATDDKDVVWHQAERCKSGKPCEGATTYTAPYPAAGTKPVGRRLRTEYADIDKLVVGCGHVAATGAYADYVSMLRVTRLSDGVSFVLKKADRMGEFDYQQPIAVSCDHVYFTRVDQIARNEAPRTNLVRIRLDALGPAIPPD